MKLFHVLLLLVLPAKGQVHVADSFFTVPRAYAFQYGPYRSPLKFYNGDTVRSAADWPRRRAEILDTWHKKMGRWPAVDTLQRLQYKDSVKRENFTQYRVRYRWTPLEYTEGYLLVPDLPGKKPAVITVYYNPETAAGLDDKKDRDFALQLARKGFVTLSVGTTQATKDQTFSLYYPSLRDAKVQPLSMLAYAAANSLEALAKEPFVDASRIGIMGHSFGGKWAMFASCLYEKFACAVWSDPGIVFDESRDGVNYWEPWYLGYTPKPWRKRSRISPENPARGLYPQLVKEGFNLHELHALMAPRPFLVSGGAEDTPARWVPLNHTIAVNKLLGYSNRVAMTNRAEHSPNAHSNEQAFQFLIYCLKK
ncbi:prolyl oligopeptidase family serine peptidase [Chitinophaga sp. YIM B06452]|uniref:prolyl oligopeptidase family serine peptidase n=1 Tax=Chitinophaga sp. YIM B06452 TaxID=3082158 RepID=UPI0031FE69B1